MTSSLPKEPLWPRAGRSGIRPAAMSSSSLVAPVGYGVRRALGHRLGGQIAPPEPDRRALRHATDPPGSGIGASEASAAAPPASAIDRSRSIRARIRRSRSSRRSSMSGGKTNRPPVVRTPNAIAHRVVGFVRDRDGDALHPELVRSCRGAPVETDGRLSGRQPLDLDVTPADAADAEPEDLGDRLLRRPSTGHRLRPVTDVAPLRIGQDAFREPRPEPLQRGPDPLHLDDVDAEFGRPARDEAGRAVESRWTGVGHPGPTRP